MGINKLIETPKTVILIAKQYESLSDLGFNEL